MTADLEKELIQHCRSEMKSCAAILVGPIQYIEIPLGTDFFFDDCWNVLNDQHQTE